MSGGCVFEMEGSEGGRSPARTINAREFYGEFHGHRVEHLSLLHERCRAKGLSIIFLAGDSTLDNKYWFGDTAPAVEGPFKELLRPPRMTMDVGYWMNRIILEERRVDSVCLNTAVEATTLRERPLAQDDFIAENISSGDALVVSIGGNDIALRPTFSTMWNVFMIVCFASLPAIEKGTAVGLRHLIRLFGESTQKYINDVLLRRTKPRRVVVCMLYFLDENASEPSWASTTLRLLGYDKNPARVQAMIQTIFREATCHISIDGVERVDFLPLFESLDGKDSRDYVQRVEPSAKGGEKLARAILAKLAI